MSRKRNVSDKAKKRSGHPSAGVHPLFTDRERSILLLIADGLSNREIAENLTLSPTTVKWYVKQIFHKLGAKRRTQAIRLASDLKLFEIPSSEHGPGHSIPVPLTLLLGRVGEVSEILHLLNDPHIRLVTILGPGGIGKTRLALEVAQQQTATMPGQVCFVSLESITSLSGLFQAVASAVGFPFHGSLDLGQQLLLHLRNRKLVLVLDNFEHLLEANQFVHGMLATAPRVKILTTSRERLNLTVETVYSLRGLAYPPGTDLAQESPAFMLFMQIAHYSQPAFQPDADDILYISRICQLVEGMPLAIELAARWIDVLSPAQIADEIVKGVGILQTTWQDLPERHRNMRAVFEHSWRLLSEEEQHVFKKLCVFLGGFDRAAAERVGGATLFILSTLVDKSLLMRVGRDRFKLHELVRQFAKEKLQEDADELAQVLHDHCHYYAVLMGDYERKIKAEPSAMSKSLLGVHNDYDNILAGWHHALETPLMGEIGKYVFTISAAFQSRGLNAEAEQTFAQALNLSAMSNSPESVSTRMRLMTHYGWFLQASNQLDLASRMLQDALGLSSESDRSHMADVGLLQGFLASVFTLRNELDAGRKTAQEGLITCRAVKFQFGVWMCLTILGQIEHSEGLHEKAYRYHHQALTNAEEHQNLYGTIQSLGHLGCICWALGNVKETVVYLQRGLSFMRAFFILDTVFLAILGIAGIYEHHDRPQAALDLLAILLHHPQSGTPVLDPTVRLLLERLQAQLSVEQVDNVMEKAKEGRFSSQYLHPNFSISPELIDRLIELLDDASTPDDQVRGSASPK